MVIKIAYNDGQRNTLFPNLLNKPTPAKPTTTNATNSGVQSWLANNYNITVSDSRRFNHAAMRHYLAI